MVERSPGHCRDAVEDAESYHLDGVPQQHR